MLSGTSTAHINRLKDVFSDPMSEVYLLFYQGALFLQREDSIIPVVHTQLNSFLKNLLGKLASVNAIQAVDEDDNYSLDYKDLRNQLPGVYKR